MQKSGKNEKVNCMAIKTFLARKYGFANYTGNIDYKLFFVFSKF